MDFIRGVSALMVCAGHLRAVMFVDFTDSTSRHLLSKPFYFLTSLGHEAVVVFFVLSGFFVGGSVLSKKMNFRFDGYLIARLSRLWTVLIPALVFTLVIDTLIRNFFPEILSGAFHSELMSGPKDVYSDSFRTFLGNITFLQTIYVPVFGTNGPLWSLTNEFWYYITFPLMMLGFGVIVTKRMHQIISLILMVIVIWFFTNYVLGGYFIWLAGVCVYLVYLNRLMQFGLWFVLGSFLIFLAALINTKTTFLPNPSGFHPDYYVAIGFSIFLISLQKIEKSTFVQERLSKLAIWLSDISYTLYVIHFPMFMLLYGWIYQGRQLEFGVKSVGLYLVWLLLVVLFSRIFWWVFERNTAYTRTALFRFRNALSKRFQRESIANK